MAVGLIAPDLITVRLADKVAATLPDLLAERVDSTKPWVVTVVADPLVGAGDALDMWDEAECMRRREAWDLAICLTDLPLYRYAGTPGRSRTLVAADICTRRGLAGLSMPVLGVCGRRRRLRQALLRLIGEIHTGLAQASGDRDTPRQDAEHGPRGRRERRGRGEEDQVAGSVTPAQRRSASGQLMTGWWTARAVPTRRYEAEDIEGGIDTRFYSPAGRGHLRLWAAMVAANRPWSLFQNFRAVIATAFATGAYGLIFPSVYMLTIAQGSLRQTVIMLAAMAAMVGWIIIAHHLWEPTRRSEAESLPMAALYNWITVLTLVVAVVLAYAVLFVLLFVTALAFLPLGYIQSQAEQSVSGGIYPLLAWTAASIATVGGALGAGLESDEDVRKATFGARQQRRQRHSQTQDGTDAASDWVRPDPGS